MTDGPDRSKVSDRSGSSSTDALLRAARSRPGRGRPSVVLTNVDAENRFELTG